jgi:hypothetical protein
VVNGLVVQDGQVSVSTLFNSNSLLRGERWGGGAMQSSVGGYSPAHAYSPTTHSRVSSMLIPPGTHRLAHGAQLPAGTSQLVEAESSEAAWRQAEGGRGGADWEDSEADLPAGEPSWAVQADMILRDVQARIEDELHREELLKDHLAMLQERHRVRNSQIRAALIILAFHWQHQLLVCFCCSLNRYPMLCRQRLRRSSRMPTPPQATD